MIQENLSRINAKKTNPNDSRVKPQKTNKHSEWKRNMSGHPEKNETTYKGATIKPAGYFLTVMTS